MVIFDYVVLFSCRGVPRGPHKPLELLGVQGIDLESKGKGIGQKLPLLSKQGICTFPKGVIWSQKFKFKVGGFIKGKKGSTMTWRKRREL